MKAVRSKPFTKRSAARLELSTPPKLTGARKAAGRARSRLTPYIHQRTRWRRQTSCAPATTTPGSPRLISFTSPDLRQPGQPLRQELGQDEPVLGQLARGAPVALAGAAVVEEVRIQPDLVVGIDLRRDHPGLLLIAEAHPAVAAVPVLAHGLAVVELDLHLDGEDEISFAVHDHEGAEEGFAFFLFRRVFLVPVGAVGAERADLVVEDVRPAHRLVEEPAEVPAGDLLHGLQEVFLRGMGEAIALEIGLQGAAQSLFAEEAFQGAQH